MRKVRKGGAIPIPVSVPVTVAMLILLLCFFQTKPAFGDEARPCAEEIATFCKDIRPGGGRIIGCLKDHEGDLTPVCKDKLQQVLKRLEEAKQICAGDIEKFCKGVKEGEGRIARCLAEHTSELTPGCEKQVEWVKSKVKKHK